MGFERAVEVIDTLGSSMSNLNSNSGFISGVASRGNRVSILAFEVANTIVKGGNLLLSVSEENIQFIKKDVLHSEGVQKLVSTDMKELLSIAAVDKRWLTGYLLFDLSFLVFLMFGAVEFTLANFVYLLPLLLSWEFVGRNLMFSHGK